MSSDQRRPAGRSPTAAGAGPRGERVGLALQDERLTARVTRLLPVGTCLAGPRDEGLDVVLLDPGRLTSERLDPAPGARPRVVVALREDDPAERVQLLARGAAAVIAAGDDDRALASALASALGASSASAPAGAQGIAPEGAREPRLRDFASRCAAVRGFLDLVGRVAASDASLLITGETGVGKEHLARAVHGASPRAAGPFVVVNCGALPETLLESELFGHEAGAFTGALRRRRGMFELARGGTVLLDEIGEMPAHLQVKLLTVLQRREVLPLGGERAVHVDVRVMSATNRDLDEDMLTGRFRKDLFYRLGVVPLRVPPLRERRVDLPDLVGRTLRDLRGALRRPEVEGVSPGALRALLRHDWPGNVRELHNAPERAVLLCRGRWITTAELAWSTGSAGRSAPDEAAPDEAAPSEAAPLVPTPPPTALVASPDGWLGRPLRAVRDEAAARAERAYLGAMLASTRGRVGEAARRAGLSARQLNEKMRRHGLRKEDYRGR